MADILPVGNGKQILFLDAEEAGFLKDLLMRHVAGTLTTGDQPLARVRKALAPVDRRLSRLAPESGHSGYAVLESYSDSTEEAYALNNLYNGLKGEGF
jgi:hypothetical protein